MGEGRDVASSVALVVMLLRHDGRADDVGFGPCCLRGNGRAAISQPFKTDGACAAGKAKISEALEAATLDVTDRPRST